MRVNVNQKSNAKLLFLSTLNDSIRLQLIINDLIRLILSTIDSIRLIIT